ncbi:hypothetical protein SAMN05421759_102640 [Roseivivax lentus]|uniref:Uncharacterized protein n=2 Tax=Roseivivax lentus TaxID=633194 RepID=A0A1N7LET8_9RHOB|nr:hypothetical protein SAMN05421759_102640 [Roseivivax lentus]
MFIRYEIPEIDKYRFLGWAFFRMKQSQRVSYIQKKVFDEEVDILRRKEAA